MSTLSANDEHNDFRLNVHATIIKLAESQLARIVHNWAHSSALLRLQMFSHLYSLSIDTRLFDELIGSIIC